MKALKILLIVLFVYVGVVVIFESLLGYFQPAGVGTMVVTTTDARGASYDRVVARLDDIHGQLYVARNHWPRAWYDRALENPWVQVTIDGERENYLAVPVSGTEHDRVNTEYRLGIVFRMLTGFPTRYILRFDPRAP